MADTQQGTSTNSNAQVKGFSNLVRTMTNDKIGVALWATRLMTVVFGMFGYILPIFGGLLGGDAVSCYYKTFMASAATSALRLHQRMPRVQLNRDFLVNMMLEDSAHYLLFSLIFIFASSPISLALVPIVLFAVLHASSYTLTLVDAVGAPSSWFVIRFLISIVELQSRNILRFIAFTEIFLLPVVALYVFRGMTWLVAPLVYYRFLGLRYASRRNPYTRTVFYMLRVSLEKYAEDGSMPNGVKVLIHKLISVVSNLAPIQS